MKREGTGTLFIHGFPWALSYLFRSLAFAFQLFEMVLCVCGFENVLKKMPCLGNLCNDSCLNIYNGVYLFEKMFQNVFWKFVLKVFVKCGLENRKVFLQIDFK